ncbi:MAG: thioredoxin family protein [Bacteroidetes bacterium]|nr:thioredoxin family protein [Bacteroidota bacterium]
MTIEEIKAIRKSDYTYYLQKGVSYDRYTHQMAEDLLRNPDPKVKEYVNLNQHRMSRVEKTYTVSQALVQQLKRLTHKTYWLVLTEHWCGDAAQTLPIFQKVADSTNGMIEMKLVYRDENPALMDAYLTGESRSIPKLIQLDAHFNVTGIWGPRPSEAQKLVKELKSNSATAASYATELHKWYALNKQKALESEVIKLVNRASMFCQDCFN